MRKIKYFTDQFQLCFYFCIGNTKQLYFICALTTQLASLRAICYCRCYICYAFSLHSSI